MSNPIYQNNLWNIVDSHSCEVLFWNLPEAIADEVSVQLITQGTLNHMVPASEKQDV